MSEHIFYLRRVDSSGFSVSDITNDFRDQLEPIYGMRETMQFLYLLFESWKGWNKARFMLEKEHPLTHDDMVRFHQALHDLKKHKPVQYVIGETWFCGLRLKVNPAVLIPRPETEELVGVVIRHILTKNPSNPEILDIGTGSGCIAVSLKQLLSTCIITATDISGDAIKLASENAERNNCPVKFLTTNILDKSEWPGFSSYDIIVSNPPYVTNSEKRLMKHNVLDYEPEIALFVPDENPLMFYTAIAAFAQKHLHNQGMLMVEINERFSSEVKELVLSQGFRDCQVIYDLNRKPRFVTATFVSEPAP